MKILGIDPGTMSFDFFGKSGNAIIIDRAIPSIDVARHPELILDIIRKLLPLDAIVGPSGYGLPLKQISGAGEDDLNLMLPVAYGDVSVNEGIKHVFRLMKKEKLPVWLTPGVIHLPTVPRYRKINRLDMGTADKVCCVALAMRDQAERCGILPSRTSFILTEAGYGFTAVMGVSLGTVVDGIGGTMGGPGFLSPGAMDAELAIRFGKKPQSVLFSGGARDVSRRTDLSPEDMAADPEKYADSWNMLIEGIEKDIAAMLVSAPNTREIILAGRLSRIPAIGRELARRMVRHRPVYQVRREAGVAKEAAEGAYIMGEGIMGGRYKEIVDSLKLRESSGTMYDYIASAVREDLSMP